MGHTTDRTWALDCTLHLDMQSGVGVEVAMLSPFSQLPWVEGANLLGDSDTLLLNSYLPSGSVSPFLPEHIQVTKDLSVEY